MNQVVIKFNNHFCEIYRDGIRIDHGPNSFGRGLKNSIIDVANFCVNTAENQDAGTILITYDYKPLAEESKPCPVLTK